MTSIEIQRLINVIKLQIQIIQLKLQIAILQKKLTVPNLPQPKKGVIHHGGGNWNFWQVNEHHKTIYGWGFKSSLGFYLGYQKFITYDGTLFIARRDNEIGAHCVEPGNANWWNHNSVGICLQGNFEIEQPTEAQLKTLRTEIENYKKQGMEFISHGQVKNTLCCGKNLVKWLKENNYID